MSVLLSLGRGRDRRVRLHEFRRKRMNSTIDHSRLTDWLQFSLVTFDFCSGLCSELRTECTHRSITHLTYIYIYIYIYIFKIMACRSDRHHWYFDSALQCLKPWTREPQRTTGHSLRLDSEKWHLWACKTLMQSSYWRRYAAGSCCGGMKSPNSLHNQ